jgi:hypothetical protein
MRCRWPSKNECPFYLNGEVDKRAHPVLGTRGVRGTPDLLVHGPGYMERNHAIIEVKNTNARDNEIRNDLSKLTIFINEAEYRRSIYLIYGTDSGFLVDRIDRVARLITDLPRIELWLHEQVGRLAECVRTLGPVL